jgi:mannose-6-phosphate isomerase-like protein (cupin superfamily)
MPLPASIRTSSLRQSARPLLPSILAAASLIFALGVQAQTMQSDHWSSAQLKERAEHLKELAATGNGSASETLSTYPRHFTMLAYRSRSGTGELHQHFADIFSIVDGHATLLTGGQLIDPKVLRPGEITGTAVQRGSVQELHAGDIVHIPAGMPHQMLVAPGDTVTYFVVKVEEIDAPANP